MKMCAIIIMALFTAPVLHGQVAEKVLKEVKAALEKKLPDGWLVGVDAEGQWVEIEREEKLLQHPPPLPNAMTGKQPSPARQRFGVRLKAGEFVSVAEYKKRSAANRKIYQELGVMAESMRGIRHKFDSFIPSNDEEREKVREYEELKAGVHELPEFFFKQAVSFVLDNWVLLGDGIEGATLLIADEGVRKQVRKDLGEAFSVLGRYGSGEEGEEGAEPPADGAVVRDKKG